MSTAELKKGEAVLLGGQLSTTVYVSTTGYVRMCALAGSRGLWSLTDKHVSNFEFEKKKPLTDFIATRGHE